MSDPVTDDILKDPVLLASCSRAPDVPPISEESPGPSVDQVLAELNEPAPEPTEADYEAFWRVMEGDPGFAMDACMEALGSMDDNYGMDDEHDPREYGR
jgi:hypothetical protein